MYFTCIGSAGANADNEGGFGARGYQIFRRGTHVVTRWGQVVIIPKKYVAPRWKYYKELVYKQYTVANAAAGRETIIADLLRKGYTRSVAIKSPLKKVAS